MARTLAYAVYGLLATLLLFEALCRVLPVSSSTASGYTTDAAIVTYPPHHRWVASTGWDLRNAHTLRANNAGFATAVDFHRDPNAIALIGDSFVEASMLDEAERPERQLVDALQAIGARSTPPLRARPVYAMGGPGSSLLDYAERIRFAHERFGVADFVVLVERGDILQALCGSGNIHSRCLDPTTLEARTVLLAPPGVLKRGLRHSALAQYMSQLKISPERLWSSALRQARPPLAAAAGMAAVPAGDKPADATSSPPMDPQRAAQIDAVAGNFFNRVAAHVAGRMVLVVDADRSLLQAGGHPVDAERRRFMELARARGALVVDLEPLFQAHFRQTSGRLDVGPYDGHLNGAGIAIAMQAAAVRLR